MGGGHPGEGPPLSATCIAGECLIVEEVLDGRASYTIKRCPDFPHYKI